MLPLAYGDDQARENEVGNSASAWWLTNAVDPYAEFGGYR